MNHLGRFRSPDVTGAVHCDAVIGASNVPLRASLEERIAVEMGPALRQQVALEEWAQLEKAACDVDSMATLRPSVVPVGLN